MNTTNTTVLIVDDDANMREFLGDLLADAGYVTFTAANGQEALERMHRQRPQIVLLDLQMPVMDGWEFRRRQLGDPALAGVAVIAVTGAPDQAEVTGSLGVPCLTKPLALPELLEELERMREPRITRGRSPSVS